MDLLLKAFLFVIWVTLFYLDHVIYLFFVAVTQSIHSGSYHEQEQAADRCATCTHLSF